MQKIDASILIVDDNPDILTSLSLYLKHHFREVYTSEHPQNLNELMGERNFECIVLDMNFRKGVNDGKEGLYWLNHIKKVRPETSVVLLTAYSNLEIAVEALKMGASDFLLKPWKNERLLSTLIRSLELQRSKKEISRLKSINGELSRQLNSVNPLLESNSSKMNEVLEIAKRVAVTDANILITGENGSGKEVLAHYIHHNSLRSERNFIKVDLGALHENLFESELFGHKRGAFTDAKSDKSGRFEMANGGTLFLDEIGNLSLNQQSKLLSVLQDRKMTAVGSSNEIDLDIRLICATNASLNQMVSDKQFRQDLMFRINTVEINIPPLRERKEDIAPLSQNFLQRYASKYDKQWMKLTHNALQELESYHWPGNIRELMHTIERAVVLAEETITVDLLNLGTKNNDGNKGTLPLPSLKLDEVEKFCIIRALNKHSNNISKTAKELNINRNTLYRKMEKYGL
jgi:DNA-binding NtrC family response regulator